MMYENAVERPVAKEPPRRTMRDIVDNSMGNMKELLLAMGDTNMVLFGSPNGVEEKNGPQEPRCFEDSLVILEEQCAAALRIFLEMRKRMV